MTLKLTMLCVVVMMFSVTMVATQEAGTPAAGAPAAGAPVTEGVTESAAEGGCRPCPVVTVQHYPAKGCTPVINETVDACCPSSYTCKTEEERGFALTSCLYKEVAYEVGKEVPVDGPCRKSCVCKKPFDETEPARIECSITECPSLFTPPKPGCRPLFSLDQCCEVDQECNKIVSPQEVAAPDTNTTVRSGDCFSEGFSYYLGDKILFGASPCQYCICTPEFSGPFGPGCTKVDCGIEYRNRLHLREGCVPLYQSGVCCNADWICPGSQQVIVDEALKVPAEEAPSGQCKFWGMGGPVGTALTTYDCHVSCTCVTPPDFTCVRYPTCEIALEARRTGYAP